MNVRSPHSQSPVLPFAPSILLSKMLPNLNFAVTSWMVHGRDEEQSSLQSIDSSASSSPHHVHHYLMPSNPRFDLNLRLPVSAAQSRVGSPTESASANSSPAEPITLFQRRFTLGKSSTDGVLGLSFNYDSGELMRRTMVKVEEDVNGEAIPMMMNKNKEKKKGAPAKNLMAERRRRRKLNERLLMLRSVVPNISKMDRVSILRDVIDYLEELRQKINHLENELDPIQSPTSSQSTSPATSSVTHVASFTPTSPTYSSRIKEICLVSLRSPDGQPARIEVNSNGSEMRIHMFCSKRPGLLLSVTRALDSVGLEIQKVVSSSFNGFVLDIYCAEQCMEGQYVHPEQIKALLLEAIGFAA